MVTNGIVPTFGLWYDLRQKPPLGDYASFYAECFEEIEEAERLGYTGFWLSEHHFVEDGYLCRVRWSSQPPLRRARGV